VPLSMNSPASWIAIAVSFVIVPKMSWFAMFSPNQPGV
jgi:hypothetical protein